MISLSIPQTLTFLFRTPSQLPLTEHIAQQEPSTFTSLPIHLAQTPFRSKLCNCYPEAAWCLYIQAAICARIVYLSDYCTRWQSGQLCLSGEKSNDISNQPLWFREEQCENIGIETEQIKDLKKIPEEHGISSRMWGLAWKKFSDYCETECLFLKTFDGNLRKYN